MAIPDFLSLSSEEEYRQFFIDNYCNKSPILTWDGLPVMFYPEMFDHAFFKRKEKNGAHRRIKWILNAVRECHG